MTLIVYVSNFTASSPCFPISTLTSLICFCWLPKGFELPLGPDEGTGSRGRAFICEFAVLGWITKALCVSLEKNVPIIKENLNRVMFFGCMRTKSLQSYPTLCDSMDGSPPGFSVHEILQARILEWVSMPSSRGSSQPRDWTHVSCVSCIGRRVLYH